MFEKRTVIITGAGASWHYGYPTGEDLVRSVQDKARTAATFFRSTANSKFPNALVIRPEFFSRYPVAQPGSLQGMADQWNAAANDCEKLASRLGQVQPLVIDYFLGQNDSLREIGKLMIAWVILERESLGLHLQRNINRPKPSPGEPAPGDNWCRFLVHKLVNGCEDPQALHANNVTFVTFNYDVSLESQIANGLRHIEMFSDQVHEFFAKHPVLHIYGRVRDTEAPPISIPTAVFPIDIPTIYRDSKTTNDQYQKAKAIFDEAGKAAQKIRTIGRHDKDENADVIQRARDEIREADCVYILGYGFDENNSRRLEMDKSLRTLGGKRSRVVLFTNYGDSNRINKKVSRLLIGNAVEFLSEAVVSTAGAYLEKSTRDVYRALEQDFDSVEELGSYPV